MLRSSRPKMFCKKGALKNFGKITRKHRCESLFFNMLEGWMGNYLCFIKLGTYQTALSWTQFLCVKLNAELTLKQFYSWVCTGNATKRCLALYFFCSNFIRDQIYFLIKMTAVNKKYILLLALRTIIKRMKRKRLQRNNERR